MAKGRSKEKNRKLSQVEMRKRFFEITQIQKKRIDLFDVVIVFFVVVLIIGIASI